MNIPVATPEFTQEDRDAVNECMESGWVSGISPYVDAFEEEFAKWNGNKYGVATNSGTTALHLSLAALDIPKGMDVIIPSFTMAASVNALLYCGLIPRFVDIDLDTWCMNMGSLRSSITSRTAAIMPVHIYGHICNMSEIMEIALEEELHVIEDAAEAHGAEFKRRKAGSLGDAGCFSLYANKIITSGEGGMITTDDEEYAARCKWLRAHAFGGAKHYWHLEIGYGYRMSGLQAALGASQLTRIDEYVQRRQMRAWRYKSQLCDLAAEDKIVFPVQKYGNMSNVYWMFSILLPTVVERDQMIRDLAERGIETRHFFYPLHRQPPYKDFCYVAANNNTMDIAYRGINLPSGNTLTNSQIDYVCQQVRELLE